jgi:hypothetical protein
VAQRLLCYAPYEASLRGFASTEAVPLRILRQADGEKQGDFQMSWVCILQSDLPKIGSKILLTGKHPWAGHIGTVEAHEELTLLRRMGARVKLEDRDHSCFVSRVEHWQQVKK